MTLEQMRKTKRYKWYYLLSWIKIKWSVSIYSFKKWLFWLIWGTWFNELKYSKFFNECWEKEDVNN